MKFASICIRRANTKQMEDGIIQDEEKMFPDMDTSVAQLSAAPTITGAAAPARVFGLEARAHAFRELHLTAVDAVCLPVSVFIVRAKTFLEAFESKFYELLHGRIRFFAEDFPYRLF